MKVERGEKKKEREKRERKKTQNFPLTLFFFLALNFFANQIGVLFLLRADVQGKKRLTLAFF